MIPAILAAISALKGAEDKKRAQREQMLQSAAQGEAFKYPRQTGLADAAQVAGGLMGGDTGKMLGTVGGAMGGNAGGVGQALGALSHPEPDREPDNDEDDYFGGIGR